MKKHNGCKTALFAVLFLLMPCFAVFAQSPQLDDYNKKKVDKWIKLAEQYMAKDTKADYKTALQYGKDAEVLARQIPYSEGLFYAYLVQAKIYEKRNAWGDKKDALKLREWADVELAKLRAKEQEAIKQKEETLNKLDAQLKNKDGVISELHEENEEKDDIIQEKDTLLTIKDIESKQKDAELRAEKVAGELAKLQMEKQKEENRFYIIFAVLAIVIAMATMFLYYDKRKTNRRLADQNEEIAREKHRSEELLLNILPPELAEELKEKGSAKVQTYEEVSVMFTDFKDFTKVSEQLSPTGLVAEIHHCFSEFDRIVDKYNIEKIKTIGDAYLCAGGLPTLDANHAENVVRAAIEIRDFIAKLEKQRKKEGRLFFEIRIGIHTGPLVAGIVGVKKFAYDIWGDTVNTAARLESSGEPGKINISGQTYKLIKDKFLCQHRGKIAAKNKGEIDMYFVEDLNNS